MYKFMKIMLSFFTGRGFGGLLVRDFAFNVSTSLTVFKKCRAHPLHSQWLAV